MCESGTINFHPAFHSVSASSLLSCAKHIIQFNLYIYTDSFVVSASKKLFQNLVDDSSTVLTVYVSVVTEPNKMCGNVMLFACTQKDIDISTSYSTQRLKGNVDD